MKYASKQAGNQSKSFANRESMYKELADRIDKSRRGNPYEVEVGVMIMIYTQRI